MDEYFQPDELEINVYDPFNGGFAHRNYHGVSITHIPSGTVVRVHCFRSQHMNRAAALDMLLTLVTDPRYR